MSISGRWSTQGDYYIPPSAWFHDSLVLRSPEFSLLTKAACDVLLLTLLLCQRTQELNSYKWWPCTHCVRVLPLPFLPSPLVLLFHSSCACNQLLQAPWPAGSQSVCHSLPGLANDRVSQLKSILWHLNVPEWTFKLILNPGYSTVHAAMGSMEMWVSSNMLTSFLWVHTKKWDYWITWWLYFYCWGNFRIVSHTSFARLHSTKHTWEFLCSVASQQNFIISLYLFAIW